MLRDILSNTLTAPVILPLIGGLLGAILVGRPLARRVISVTALALTLVYVIVLASQVFSSGPLIIEIGNWSAPFGIVFVADGLSLLMLLMSCTVGLAVMLYSFADTDAEIENFSFHPLFLIQLMGVNGAFLAGDVFNLYVWFEVLLTASFALLCVGSSREQLQAGIPYLVINLLSSTMFLIACGLLYGLAGTLNMAQLAERLGQLPPGAGISTVLASLFLLGYAIKAGVFPLFAWLPTSYHTPPVAVTALFSALMTKVGVYALLRIFPLIFPDDLTILQPLILWSAGLTMLVGVLGALAQYNIRRLLSFHIISQVGYLLMGFAIGNAAAIAATALFIVHVAIAKAALFMIGGVAERDFGTPDLRLMGGLLHRRPGLAVLFAIAALSLAGIPPLSGFVVKLALVQATFAAEAYLIGGVSLFVSLLTFASMLKIWHEAFWKDSPTGTAGVVLRKPVIHDEEHDHDEPAAPAIRIAHPPLQPLVGFSLVVMVLLTVLLGILGEPAVRMAQQAGANATDVAAYIQLVLGSAAGGVR